MNNTTQNPEAREYEGTPEEVGAQLAADALGPTIEAASATAAPHQVARMMAGMLAYLAGAVSENFGPKASADMLRGTAEKVEQNADVLRPTH